MLLLFAFSLWLLKSLVFRCVCCMSSFLTCFCLKLYCALWVLVNLSFCSQRTSQEMLTRVLSQRALVRAVPSVRFVVRAAPRLTSRPAIRLFSEQADQSAPQSQPPRERGPRQPRKGPTSTGGKKETGVVKWFNQQKVHTPVLIAQNILLQSTQQHAQQGYGFVTRDNGEGDVFVHFTEIVGAGFRTLEENQKVTFEVANGPKGQQAQVCFSARCLFSLFVCLLLVVVLCLMCCFAERRRCLITQHNYRTLHKHWKHELKTFSA